MFYAATRHKFRTPWSSLYVALLLCLISSFCTTRTRSAGNEGRRNEVLPLRYVVNRTRTRNPSPEDDEDRSWWRGRKRMFETYFYFRFGMLLCCYCCHGRWLLFRVCEFRLGWRSCEPTAPLRNLCGLLVEVVLCGAWPEGQKDVPLKDDMGGCVELLLNGRKAVLWLLKRFA